MEHPRKQSTAKIANVTLPLVTFLRGEKYRKNASKPIRGLGSRPKLKYYQKAKKDTIWYLFSQIGIFFNAKSHRHLSAKTSNKKEQ